MTTTAASPTRATERHLAVDALRGFALLGILVVNIEFLVQPIELGFAEYESTLDLLVRGFIHTTSLGKIYPIFALLFGYGFALQASRARDDFWPRYRRRMVVLIGMGVLHGILFFPGDILVLYGVVGLIAFRSRNWTSEQLVRRAAWLYGIAAIVWLALAALDGRGAVTEATPEFVDAVTNGSFADVTAAQFEIWLVTAAIIFVVQGPFVLASYWAGMALGRTTWLSDPPSADVVRRRALRWLPIGLVVAAIAAWTELGPIDANSFGFSLGTLISPLVGAGYIAAVVSLPSWAQRLLQPSGRMSLTVYLLESVVVALLALGYGFGLVGDVSPLGGLVLAVGVWAGLSVFSHVWMARFRFGPLEWVLRSISYGRRQPLRLE